MPGNLGLSPSRRHPDGEEGRKEREKEKESSHDALSMVEKKHGVQFTSPWWARTAECRAYDPAGAEAAFAAAWILRSASSSRGSKPWSSPGNQRTLRLRWSRLLGWVWRLP